MKFLSEKVNYRRRSFLIGKSCRAYLLGSKSRRHPSVLFERASAVVVGLRLSLRVQMIAADDGGMAVKLARVKVRR